MISVIVPVYNEQENAAPLIEEIAKAAVDCPISEIVYVDDGSDDNTHSILVSLQDSYPMLRVVRHTNRSGQSAAMWTGVSAANNEIVVTLDGDGQNNPADIKNLYRLFQSKGQGAIIMIAGQREKREDNFVRRVSSRMANKLRSSLLKDNTRDTGCSLKMFRKIDYIRLPFFNHMHRFLPALMMRDGVQILHVDVSHRPRTRGKSKYGTFDRLMVSFLDLVGVMWLMRRARPKTEIIESAREDAKEKKHAR